MRRRDVSLALQAIVLLGLLIIAALTAPGRAGSSPLPSAIVSDGQN